MRQAVRSGECPGYVSYRYECGQEEWSCCGWADVEAKRQMDARTVFRICSMTKSLVGALAAILADRGEIDLDDRVSRHFPEFVGEKASITLRQCLSMTAGFVEMSPSMLRNGLDAQSPESVAHEMSQSPLIAPPGTRFAYSNPGFEVAAAVMERQTGCDLDELLEETLFHPLGMTETTFRPTDDMLRRLAVVYRLSDGAGCVRAAKVMLARAAERKEVCLSASGGLYSTPLDMARFYRMLMRGGRADDGTQVMSAGAMALISVKQTPASVAESYSLGFFRRERWLGHGGAYGTVADCDPSRRCMRMLFMQVTGEPKSRLVRQWKRSGDDFFDVSLSGSRWFDD